MNRDVVEQWCNALESGEYKQGRGVMRDRDDNYCCLGVLCDLAVKAGVIGEPIQPMYSRGYGYGESITMSALLPYEVQDWVDIESCDPELRYWDDGVYRESSCTFENDCGDRDFTGIAALIRANYLEPADVS